MRIFALCLLSIAPSANAHELWLEPLSYEVSVDGTVAAQIVNGQQFDGLTLSYIPHRAETLAVFYEGQILRLDPRAGDRPALNNPALGEGLHVAAYQTTVSEIEYEEWEKFETFVAHKDLGITLADHLARDLPDAGFKEAYTRFSKTLISVGHGEGSDRRTGLETELVALTNPYTDDLSDGMLVQLFYRATARADEQVEVFDKAPDETVSIFTLRTDDRGIATIPVTPGHSYMVDAVYLREPAAWLSDGSDAAWETLWANLTFAVPAD